MTTLQDTIQITTGAVTGIAAGQYIAPIQPQEPYLMQVFKLLLPVITPILTTYFLHKFNQKNQ